MNLKPLYVLGLVAVLIFWPKEKQRYIMTFDKRTRPITGCLQIGLDGYTAASIAMNCQRSISENIHLCSQGRLLKYFDTKDACEKEYEFSKKLYGTYNLDSDEFNSMPTTFR
jgi:hypothetical protein